MAFTIPNYAPIGSLLKGDKKPRKQARAVKDDSHRKFVSGLPCIVSGVEGKTQVAHVRFASAEYGKPITGTSTKADDCFVLPLSVEMHDEQHRAGDELAWWRSKGVSDPLRLCLRLYSVSGDEIAARKLIGTVERR
jgi:hypothetical protein